MFRERGPIIGPSEEPKEAPKQEKTVEAPLEKEKAEAAKDSLFKQIQEIKGLPSERFRHRIFEFTEDKEFESKEALSKEATLEIISLLEEPVEQEYEKPNEAEIDSRLREPIEQLHRGVEILRDVVVARIDAFGQMPRSMTNTAAGMPIGPWATYAEAKAENNRQIAKAVEQAQWGTTSAGLKLAYLETDFFGAPGALYGVGAQIVVAFSRHFGPAGVRKFTVAGNGIRVDSVLPKLNALESGWGGPATGTIVGSPREGSKLDLQEVVAIVKETL